MKILMVCLGNICRSPLAEGILKQKATASGLEWDIESAGIYDFNPARPPHPLSRKVALINRIDIDKKLSRVFTRDDVNRFDKIYAMSSDVISEIQSIAGNNYNVKKVGLLMDELFPGKDIQVPDPICGTEPDFVSVFKLIDSACEKIVEKYAAIEN